MAINHKWFGQIKLNLKGKELIILQNERSERTSRAKTVGNLRFLALDEPTESLANAISLQVWHCEVVWRAIAGNLAGFYRIAGGSPKRKKKLQFG